ncbi:MAG: hypothetical protein P1V51_23465 [Deltaproteobacteria bacterium]|nr:hypothetical protein [Deltaproteobacteria bacterium]
MRKLGWMVAALTALQPGGARAALDLDAWVDARGSLSASVPDLEHPDDPTRSESAPVLPSAAPVGGLLFAPPERLVMDDLLAGDLAWSRGIQLAGGLETGLPGQGRLELVVGLSLDTSWQGGVVQARDRGSRLRLGWPLWQGRLALELLPFGSPREGPAEGLATTWLGHSFRGWGDAPLLELSHHGRWYEVFTSLRGAVIDKTIETATESSVEKRGSYQLFLGGALRPTEQLRVHVGAGHSLAPPTLVREAVRGQGTAVRGFSLGLQWSSLGLASPRGERLPLVAEPALTDGFFDRPPLDGVGWWDLRLEGSWLQQYLEDTSDYGATRWQAGWALAAVARGGLAGWSLELGYLGRSVPFITETVPSLLPFVALDASMHPRAGQRGHLALGRSLAGGRLHLGLAAGVWRPAQVRVDAVSSGPNPSPVLTGQRRVIVRGPGELTILPLGEDAVPQLDARVETLWFIDEALVLGAQVFVRQNGNRTTFEESAAGETIAVFSDPFSVGVNLALRFRFAADTAGRQRKGA